MLEEEPKNKVSEKDFLAFLEEDHDIISKKEFWVQCRPKNNNKNNILFILTFLIDLSIPKEVEANEIHQSFNDCPYIIRNCGINQSKNYLKVLQEAYDTSLDKVDPIGLLFLKKLQIIQGVGLALEELHKNNVTHRFVQPFTIAVSNLQSDKVTAKLNIFSKCYLPFYKYKYLSKSVEIDQFNPPQAKQQKFDERSDLWSLGATFFWLLFGSIEGLKACQFGQPPSYPKNTPKWIIQILDPLLQPNPRNRGTLKTFLDCIKGAFVCAENAQAFFPITQGIRVIKREKRRARPEEQQDQ